MSESLESDILDSLEDENPPRRRKLLPWWIKFFCWVFMIFGVVTPIALMAAFTGTSFNISLYGLNTSNPMSIIGILATALFGFKGIAAFGLWTEKDWAITLGKIDAVVGIAVCVVVMLLLPIFSKSGFNLNFRLELILLIPFLIRLQKIEIQWNDYRPQSI